MSGPTIDLVHVTFDLAEEDHNGSRFTVLKNQSLSWPGMGDTSGGDDHGGVAVRFLVDSDFNQVMVASGPTSNIAAIEYAISVLTATLAALRQIPNQRLGHCLHQGETGQCLEPIGHLAGQHRYPAHRVAS